MQHHRAQHSVEVTIGERQRLGKPILALTTHTGDTAALLREVGGATIVNLASEDEIREGLSPLGRNRKGARSAAHIQDSLAG